MAESRRKTDSQHASDEDRVVKVDEFVRKHASAVDVETLRENGVKTINYLTVSKVNELVSREACTSVWVGGTAQQLSKLQLELRVSEVAVG